MEEKKPKPRGGKREGAGRKPKGGGKSMYFRFRCSEKVYDIIHMHEEDGMSEWITQAILEKQRREEWR